MTVTVTLSEKTAKRLQAHADEVHLSIDALVEELLMDALPVEEINGLHTPDIDTREAVEDPDAALTRVVARIKATPPNPAAVHPATKSVDELIADLAANPPSDELLTFAEMWPLWQAFEQELKAMDEADAIRDGRS
jgi:hypothetical protein